MYTSILKRILAGLVSEVDDTAFLSRDLDLRFAKLRAVGRLPKERSSYETPLTDLQIADALLSLVPPNPVFSGMSSISLGSLRSWPSSEALWKWPDLRHTIAGLIAEEGAISDMRLLSVSPSLVGTNAHGYARLEWGTADSKTIFLPQTVLTAERGLRPTAKAAVELRLRQRFFRLLRKEILASRRLPAPTKTLDHYESIELANEERLANLGVTPSSRYLNIGVEVSANWPDQGSVVCFNGVDLILLPPGNDKSASVHIDLARARITELEGMTLINRFLSTICWYSDGYAIFHGGWAGNPVPVPVPESRRTTPSTGLWAFPQSSPPTADAQRALALYREGRNAEQIFSIAHAVVSYFRVIEVVANGKSAVKKWIKENLDALQSSSPSDIDFDTLNQLRGSKSAQDYLYTSCRVAVAHDNRTAKSDPDDLPETRRLHSIIELLRLLARRAIENDLGVGRVISHES